MNETLTPGDDLPRWSPEIEAEVETGAMTPFEADEREGLVEPETPSFPEPDDENQIDRRVDQGVTNYGGAKAMTGASAETPPHHQRTRPGWVKDEKGIRRKIRTPADARAADRLPDDQWMLR